MGLKNLLRRSGTLARAYRQVRNLTSGRGWGAFHHDRIYRNLILDLLEAFPFTSFVETGTFRGYSTEFVAVHHPALPVFTSEVYEPSYRIAKSALKRYPNVSADLGSSDQWIKKLLDEKRGGDFPLFFLDAHWQNYWPLRAELAHISAAKLKAVIVIDDFEVPGQPQFEFDVDGGGELTAGLKCNLDYIRPSLSVENSYRAIFPKYSHREGYGNTSGGLMRGHIALFQNALDEYQQFLRRPLAQNHYFGIDAIQVGS